MPLLSAVPYATVKGSAKSTDFADGLYFPALTTTFAEPVSTNRLKLEASPTDTSANQKP